MLALFDGQTKGFADSAAHPVAAHRGLVELRGGERAEVDGARCGVDAGVARRA